MPSNITHGVLQVKYWALHCFFYMIVFFFRNDLPAQFKTMKLILYGDDTDLFSESKDLNSAIPQINADLKRLHRWCTENKFTIIFDKTNDIIMENTQNRYIFKEKLIILNDSPINKVDTIKLLNCTWSFAQHCQSPLK